MPVRTNGSASLQGGRVCHETDHRNRRRCAIGVLHQRNQRGRRRQERRRPKLLLQRPAGRFARGTLRQCGGKFYANYCGDKLLSAM
jgi:hypothetical protein